MMRVADYIADFIHRQGVRDVFMLTGGGSIYLDDGIACHERLNEVCVRNEATAPMMAEAYARLTGNLGVAMVTTGPGGTNAITGVAEAWVDSAPVLVISGQVQRDHTSLNAGIKDLRTFGIQEINIIEMVKSITKYAVMVNEPESIRFHLEKAVSLAKLGRPGPVWLDIPLDVQAAMIDETQLRGYKPEGSVSLPLPSDREIEEITSLLMEARRPLVIVGQGVRIAGAMDEFRKLIEILDLPVISSRLGQDILPYSHSRYFGHGGIKGLKHTGLIMEQSDVVLALGSRLAVPFVGTQLDAFADDARIIMVDIDEAELTKPGIRLHLPVRADVKHVISALLKKASESPFPSHRQWIETCNTYKKEYPLVNPEQERNPIDLYHFINCLDSRSSERNVFVSDAGSSYYVTGQALRFEKGQREVTSGAFASMGLAIPLAIGCAIADKDAEVLAVTGDGSLELNIQELKTMSLYNLNIKLFVINNGGYVSIRNTQDTLFEGRHIGSAQAKYNEMLDFQKVAAAFDLPYYLIENCEEINSGLSAVLGLPGPAFVEVLCDHNQKIVEPVRRG
ncbi:MAG: thiamine pyrophosphate-binding protein [Syntrophobacteraceae bacterium]